MGNQNSHEFHFDKIFKEKDECLEYVYKTYNKIYDLKNIYYEGKVSRELYNYVLKRKFFILLVIYDEDRRVYLERNIQDDLFWSLPGGSIKKNEEIHAAIRRISEKIPSGQEKISIGEIEPIAFITNNFKYNDEEFSHYGFAFVARLRNKNKINIDDSTGCLVYPTKEEINKINRFANREVLKLAIERIKTFDTPAPEEEVSVNEKYNFRYMIHNQFVKKFILTDELKRKVEFIKLLKSYVGSAESLVDVSCGDSSLIQKIAPNNCKYIVANDISWSQIELIGSSQNVIYTNHNAEYFPFKENSFDIAYCGNTLHHMESKKGLLNLFSSMEKVAKKIIIVEIENPKESSTFSYILNKYWYGYYLKDVGGSYFNKNDFQSIISDFFIENFDIEFSEFKNIQGNYLIASLTKKDADSIGNKVIEIEHKFNCDDTELLTKKCEDLGYKYISHQQEKDEYFTDINGVFVKDRVCLRIRTTDVKSELTYKGKSVNSLGSYSKEENNISILPSQVSSVDEFLTSLGYLKYSVVDKDRVTYTKKESSYKINVTIDNISNAGGFVEFELIANANISKEEIKNFETLLQKEVEKFKPTGLSEAKLPYRDYVANYIKNDLCNASKIKAVLFDFDGTVAPTEKIFFSVIKNIVKKEFGREITYGEYKDNELDKNGMLFDTLREENVNIKLNRDQFMKLIYEQYEIQLDQLKNSDHLLTNLQLIRLLKNKGYKVAIVSTSKREFIDKILNLVGYGDLFDLIIAREDVKQLKPDPAAYLLALKKLNIKPQECIAIEDSIRGVQSAKGAQIKCLVVQDSSFLSDELDAGISKNDFNHISEICLPLIYSET